MPEDIRQIIDAIISPQVQEALFLFKIIFLAFGIFFLGFLIFFIFRTPWFKHFIWWDLVELITRRPYGGVRAAGFWKKAEKKLDSLSGKSLDKAMVSADKHFERLLERLVPLFQTKTFDERISKLGEATFSEIDKIKKAHIVAETIKQGAESKISEEKKLEMLKVYGRAFKELSIFNPIEK